MAKELYARFETPSVGSVGVENFERLEAQHLLEKGELYLVLFVEKKAKTTGVYLNISGIRGMALNAKAFSFFTRESESGALIPHNIDTDPDYEYKGDDYYLDR